MSKNKITADSLRAHGYTYKIDVLTGKERQELKVGRKVKEIKKDEQTGEEIEHTVTYESRDYDYFFKVVVPADKKLKKPAVECRIFHAVKEFYYNGSRVKNIKQLPNLEKHAKDTAHYAELQAKVVDTKAPVYARPVNNIINNVTGELQSGYIQLIGGPLEGQFHKYNTAFPFFMLQFKDGDRTLAARYVRDWNDPRLADEKGNRLPHVHPGDKTKYNFLNIIE